MLENWYFCAALGMPVEDAATHLDVILALREPPNVPRAAELVCDALDSLHAADTTSILHALPHVLAAHRRFPEHEDITARVHALYRVITSVSHERVRDGFGALLREAGGGNWDNAVGLLERVLAEVRASSRAADPTHAPYLDLAEQLTPTLVVVVGRFLAWRRPHLVRDCLGEPPALLTRALRGDHGRLALIQAAEFKARVWPNTAEAVRGDLARASGGAFDMEPDLLASAALVTFAPSADATDPDTVASTLDTIQNEALCGAMLLGWVEEYAATWGWQRPEAVARRQAAYVRLGGIAGHRDSAMPSVLWMSVLTALVAELAPDEAVRRIEAWWQPPVAFPDRDPVRQIHLTIGYDASQYGRVLCHTGRLLSLRAKPGGRTPTPSPTPGPASQTAPESAARVWSPWIPDRAGTSSPLADDEPERLVRLLGAGLLAERLLTDGRKQEEHPRFLLLLMVHIRDVLGRSFRDLSKAIGEHQGRSLVPAGHLAALITHTGRVVDRVGKGLRPTVRPTETVAMLQALHQLPPQPYGHALRGLLHHKNELKVALAWVEESAAGGIGPHRTEAGGRWFTGESSAADALFDLVAERETVLSRPVSIQAALLRSEVRGGTHTAHFRWDWSSEAGGPVPPPIVRASGPQPLDHKALLLSSPTDLARTTFSVQDWELMGDALEEQALERLAQGVRAAQHVPVTVRTLRIAALLEQSDLGDEGAHSDWVASWAELLRSFNSAQGLPRVIRGRLLDLFPSKVAGDGSQDRLNAVLERVIDTIIELSSRATLYYDRLFAEVGAELTLPAESASQLRYRVLRSFYHRSGRTTSAPTRITPFDAYGSRISARGTQAALVTLLRDTAHLESQVHSARLATLIEEAWQRTQEPHKAPARRQDADAIHADPRLILGATMDRRTAEAVLYLRDERLDTAVLGHRRPDVRDLFETGSDSDMPAESFVLGLVAGVRRVERGMRLFLNCGLPQLVTRDFARFDSRWTVGRVAAVKIRPGERTATYIAPLATPEPRPGEVRAARLASTDTYPRLALEIDGFGGYGYPAGATARDIAARRRWDPDLSRAFAGQPAWEREILAVWHAQERHWMPLDAGLPELAVAESGSADRDAEERGLLRLALCGPATDRSGHGPAWRFSLTPGRSYVLGASDWEDDDWQTLHRACTAEPFALIVYARFHRGERRLRLSPPAPGSPAIDRRNVRWLAAFTRTESVADEETRDEGDAYEEAVRTTGADGVASWRITVPRVEGFPDSVTAKPDLQRTHVGSSFMCAVTKWGEPEARKAEVTVLPVEEKGIELPCTLENFVLLHQFRPYQQLYISLLHKANHRDPEKGTNVVRTAHGILGFADTDSLTLTGEFGAGGSARRAVVVSDTQRPPRQRRAMAPLPHDRLTEAVGHGEIEHISGAELRGMVARQVRNPERTTVLHIVLWLRTPSRAVEVRVPAAAFDHGFPAAGDHVVARRDSAGWTFAVLQRTIRLRALWIREAAPGEGWKPVGEVAGENGVQHLYQHPGQPRVATSTADAADGRTVAVGRVKAQKADNRQYNYRAVVHMNDRALVGTVSSAEGLVIGDRPQDVYLERTDLVMDDIVYQDGNSADAPRQGDQLVDVQRHFTLSPVVHNEPSGRPRREAASDARAEWERMLAAGTVTGQRTPDGHMRLPRGAAPDDEGTLLPWLVAADEPHTLIAGRLNPYPDRARCAFVPSGQGYRASFVRVPPVSVAAFMAEVLPQARPDGRRFKIPATRRTSRRPYYIGVDTTADGLVHRFEFGYGWILEVPESGLTVGGRTVDPTGLTLFHGDRIDAVSFGRDTTESLPGGVTMDISPADISKGIESHVRKEADNHVVHLLDVDVDYLRKHVAVLRVHTGSRKLEAGGEDVHVREERLSASLDPDDVKVLLAAQGPRAGRRKQILARMVREPNGYPRLKPRFRLVLPRTDEGGQNGLREGDSLYLLAGSIHQTANNLFLQFELPGDVDQQAQPLTVQVGRREFSHRENCLRRAVEADGDDVYRDAKMLVRLDQKYDNGVNVWRGSTKSPKPRSLPLLRSYLDNLGTDCFGVLDATGRAVELRPGVLFPTAEISGAANIAPGSVVRLRRDGVDGVGVTTAIPADATFLGDAPRPVVVFPKDDLKNPNALSLSDYSQHFTVAGLPGLTAGAARSVAHDILRAAHPKIVGAVPDTRRGGNTARLVPLPHGAMAARIILPDDVADGPSTQRFNAAESADGPSPGIKWAQLSFMDGTASEVARACRDRYWRYHDSRTWRWVAGRGRSVPVPLPERARSVSEPVFLSSAGGSRTLRHRPGALRRFGFPATDLVEVVRREEGGHRTAWAVAWSERRAVWLEVAPGRVVEVRSELVRLADGSSLAELDWSLFSPGDLVYGRVEGGVNECGHIVLDSWHAGARGAIGSARNRRMLLPVAFADEVQGALHLGEGSGSFPYPADRHVIQSHPAGSSVWLDRDNDLTALGDSPVVAGDVVFVSSAPDGGLRVLGFPSARVLVAGSGDRSDWPGSEWLCRELIAALRGGTLPPGLSSLPVTVLHVEDGPTPTLTVSRRGQPRGFAPDGAVLVQPVADLGEGFVAVRSGSALFRVGMAAMLPGLPRAAAATAAAAFVADGSMVKLVWDGASRSLTGSPADRGAPFGEHVETSVRPWFPVSGSDGVCLGVVCHDTQARRLCWLPAAEASWAADLPGDVLVRHLARRHVNVLRTGPHTVTLVGHPMIVRSHDKLTVGQRVRVTVIDADSAENQPGELERSLVAVEPAGVLARYLHEAGTMPEPGHSLQAEVSRAKHAQGRRTVSLVEPGSRLTTLDVPSWLADALHRLYLPHVVFGQRQPVTDLVPRRFHEYQEAYDRGLSGADGVPGAAAGAAHGVLHALGRAESDRDTTTQERAEAVAAIKAWLCSAEGRNTVHQRAEEVDLLPLLAVCRLGDRLGGGSVGLPNGWLAYLLSRLGDRAVSSLHTEALVTQWLVLTERHVATTDPWPRLRTVEVKAGLTPRDVGAVIDFSTSVTGRPAVGLGESEAAPVARSLLAAVGALPSADALRADSPILSPLADLGAALRPARSEGAPTWPVPGLLSTTRRPFNDIMRRSGAPLTLLPACVPLTEPMKRYADRLLRAAE
ncbi:hypothetical protein PV726_16835 [Streptomyces europaeiscabiei]|uniref:hypothetical protein n=1 Tax=Streptomyces europaeiscabiei TaxID=146819 RepID=UPI0029B0C28C|nr:hypothetical protein [Streptomyces europaeiscabiei]MDX3691977.1 hypothetical protein [Streptomyces europaeiscabiei]